MTRYRLKSDEVQAAVWKIARTPEGQLLFSALQSVVEEIGPVETCALHAHNARRIFAADLIAMAEADLSDGIESESTGRRNAVRSERKSRRHGPAGRE